MFKMHWYEGSIAEAVSLTRKNGSIFVVYIEGNDEESTKLTNIINEENVSKELGSNNFVAIKVEANSLSHQQFSEIYKGVKVPSIYFIGKSGAPLDIIERSDDSAEFLQKIHNILKKSGITISKPTTQGQQSSDLITHESQKNIVHETGVCTSKTDQEAAGTSGAVSVEDTETLESTVATEDKVEKAKELIEKNRELKRKDEEEKEKLKEIERRKMGQDVQKMKRWQQDQELKQFIEEREKEKKEQLAAKQRILEQIKQDRVDRAARFSTNPQPILPSPQSVNPPNVQKVLINGMTRIQFKLPDGSTHTHEFQSDNTLQEVKTYIQINLNLSFNFVLATTFPKREFTDEHDSSSLAELELVPSAVLLILPVSHGTVSTNSRTFTSILWSLLAPLFNMLSYLKSLVFGAPKPAEEQIPPQDNNKRPANILGETSRPPPLKKRMGETTVIKRQGNIHRLSDKNDSDDDTNTWNGNSTQQM